MYGKGLVKGLGITLKHHFGKKLTVQYPEQYPYLQQRFRGHLYLEFEKCMACGLCVRTCPNGVLSFEDAKDAGSKKKKLMSYTIDHQYCMYCNLCVETCTQNCLHFSHDFELSRYHRDDIKKVYYRPAEMDIPDNATDTAPSAAEQSAAPAPEDKRDKQIKALAAALEKNPQKLLAKYVDSEDQVDILIKVCQDDPKIAEKIIGLMADDREKAKKVAQALVNKAIKQSQGQPKGGNAE